MDEKEIQEFDLDDIIKEFADPDEEIREKTAEEILQEATAEVTAPQEPQEEAPQEDPEPAPVGGDTVRFQPGSGSCAPCVPDRRFGVRQSRSCREERHPKPSV